MKKTIILIIILLQAGITLAQNNKQQLNNEQAMAAAKKLIEFDEQFDNGAPESLKLAKFNEFVNQLHPEMTAEDRKKAYDVVNWYIKASKGQQVKIPLSEEQQRQAKQMLNETEQQKQAGMQAMYGKVAEMKNMSYSEFKNYVTNNGSIILSESEIQQAYNAMHTDDGKQVKVTPKDKTKIDNPVKAVEIIDNKDKHTYQEFRAALKFLQPDMSEENIQKLWNSKQ